MRWSLIIACGLGLLGEGTATAELLYFARGGQAQLAATVQGDRVILDTPDGPRSFPRADFAAIVPGHRPFDDWTARQAAATGAGTVEARFAAAWWALENGLTDEAIHALEALRSVASTPGPTARAIASIDRLALPCPDPGPGLESLRARLRPLRFREHRSPHVVLLHQLEEAEALERLDVIERVVRSFHLAYASQGFDLATPSHRLISVVFAERRDYVEFLRKVDADAFAETQGFYHPVLHTVFAFDSRSGEAQKAGRRALARRKAQGDGESDLVRRGLLLDLDWRANDLGILAHETIHQLADDSGLAPRFDDFPTWLHEGLASQFEVVRGGRWAGFGRANDLRLPDWRAIHPSPRLAPLLRDSGFGHGYRRDLYAESWALVYFLRKTHPLEFQAFLDRLRTPVPGASPPPDRASEAFRLAFGPDLAALESAWHQFLEGQRTPLEAGRPTPPARVEAGTTLAPERRLVEPGTGH